MTEPFGYSLSVLEKSINNQAQDAVSERDFMLVDRQLALAHIERLEHIALALDNLSDVGDVVASKLTFGVVPDAAEAYGPEPLYTEKRYGAAPPSPGGRPGAMSPPPVALPFCDVPGCKEAIAHEAVIDGVGRRVCVIHAPILGKQNPEPQAPNEAENSDPLRCNAPGCMSTAKIYATLDNAPWQVCPAHTSLLPPWRDKVECDALNCDARASTSGRRTLNGPYVHACENHLAILYYQGPSSIAREVEDAE